MMRFAQPWLLAFGVPLVLFVLLRLRRLPPSLVGARRRFVQACLALGALAGLMAAAGLELGHPVDRMAVVFVVDRSRSVVAPDDPSADSLDTVELVMALEEEFECEIPDEEAEKISTVQAAIDYIKAHVKA